jgi:predicted transcriptional regulator
MRDIPQLVAAIDSRLADIAAEISALDAAKAELTAPRAGVQKPAVGTDAIATRSRRAARPRVTSPPQQPESATGRRATEPVETPRDVGSTVAPQRSTRKRAPTVTRRRSGGGVVRAETLEELLADTSAGLSATAIATEAGAGYSRTLKLLHELEATGQVRRSGSRRSTVWQLITDEERVAERVAELERLRSAPGQRRGRARAS